MKRFFYFVIIVLSVMFALPACQDNEKIDGGVAIQSDTARKVKGYEIKAELSHLIDSVKKTEVTDEMDSKLTAWRTVDGERTEKVYDNVMHPMMHMGSLLSKQDYVIDESMLNCQPSSSTILRGSKEEADGTKTEVDTVRYWFPDEQVWSIPVSITNCATKIGNSVVDFASLTLTGHKFQYRKDTPKSATRAQYKSGAYNSEYKSILEFKETNIENPKKVTAPIYAFTGVYTMKDDKLVRVEVDTTRVWVDPTTEKDIVTITEVYESEITLTQNYEIEVSHLFKGRKPYEKTVSNFDHRFISSDDIVWGSEAKRESGNPLWTVYGKNGSSKENIGNGIAADKADAYYDYYVERPVFRKEYSDTTVMVDFGYAPVEIQEMQTSVTAVESDKEGTKKAIVKNFLSTSYLGGGQTLCDTIYLYRPSKDIKDEILKGEIYVVNDSVCADINRELVLEDGTVIKSKEHWSDPWITTVTTDWTSVQEVLSQITDQNVEVNLTGSNAKNRGSWYWNEENYTLSNYAHLYNGENMLNGRVTKFPNKLVYKSAETGKTFNFDVLTYSVKTLGGALNLKEGDTYDYSEVEEETLGGYSRSNTAHGTLKLSEEKVLRKEARNKVQTVTIENVHNEFDLVTVYASHEDVEHKTHNFPRTIATTTNWKATEKNASEKTAQPTAKLTASQATTDGAWSCNMQTRDITATVTLNGSTQYNGWTAKDPNNVKYVEDGLIVTFDEINFAVAYVNSSATLENKEVLTETYKYTNTISVSFGDNMQNVSAPGLITVNKDKEVTGHEFRNKRLVITNSDVTASLTYVTLYNDGSEDKEDVKKVFPRTINPYTSWKSDEDNGNVTTGSAKINLTGSDKKQDGNWSYVAEKRNITTIAKLNASNQSNGWEAMDPNKIKYTRDGQVCDFGTINFAADEAGQEVEVASNTANLTVYNYTDKVTVTFGDNKQTVSAPGVINVAKNVIVGYEIRNKVLTITNDNVNAACDFVTIYKDREEKEHVTRDFPRSITCTTNWKATEKNADEKTAQPIAKLSASQNMTDDEWSWVDETRDITAEVKLSGSTQYNGWQAKDPNSIKFTKEGVTADFGKIAHSTAYVNSSAKLTNTEVLTETYAYSNTISVSYGDNMQSISAPGTIIVNKEKEIVGHEFRDRKLVITNSDVTASLTYVTLYNDKSEDTENVSKVFPRTLNPYTSWTSNEEDNSVSTGSAKVNLVGNGKKQDGNWSYVAESRDITTNAKLHGSNQTNGWEAQDPNNIKYTRDGEVCDFGTIDFNANEAGQDVKVASESATLTVYNYTDKITVTFGDNVQTVSAPGVINVKKEKTIVGYEITNANQTISQDGVTNSLTFVTKWSDGTTDEENISKFFARNFRVISDWSSNEENANQSTGSASVNLKSSENKQDGDWSYVSETRDINTTATLNGSSQTNAWEAQDPNKFIFSRNGVSHDFGTISFSATETGAKVNKKSENADETVYDYTDNISVMFGSNSFASSAPGLIKVAAPWNPDFDHGKFKACVFTTARNENRNTWVWIASVHFEKGTMPLIIRQGATAPEVNEAYFEAITDNRLNSGTWIPSWGKWINTIATDTPDLMQWDTVDGANADNLLYPTATAWGWDDGRTVSGHPSVTTDKFSAKISQNGYVLTIYRGSEVFATYKAAK